MIVACSGHKIHFTNCPSIVHNPFHGIPIHGVTILRCHICNENNKVTKIRVRPLSSFVAQGCLFLFVHNVRLTSPQNLEDAALIVQLRIHAEFLQCSFNHLQVIWQLSQVSCVRNRPPIFQVTDQFLGHQVAIPKPLTKNLPDLVILKLTPYQGTVPECSLGLSPCILQQPGQFHTWGSLTLLSITSSNTEMNMWYPAGSPSYTSNSNRGRWSMFMNIVIPSLSSSASSSS